MNKNEAIHAALNKICKSKLFSESSTSCELLSYLVKATLNNEKIKELNIAFDVFNKDKSFDPASDATVRVNIHNLRNRLNSYYLNEGKDDRLRISIPKGHYYVSFTEIESKRQSLKTKSLVIAATAVILIVLAFFSGALLQFPTSGSTIDPENFVWNTFLEKPQPTVIVVGNYYFMSLEIDTLASMYIRNIDVNSDQDLERYLARYPQYADNLSRTSHSFFTKDVPFSLSYILLPFYMNYKIPTIKLSSDFILDDLKENNVIFIGSYKNIGILHPLLQNLKIEYRIRENLLDINFPDSAEVKSFKALSEDDVRSDYCLIAKLPVHDNNSVLLFLSIHDIGNISSVKKFTDASFLETFHDTYFEKEDNVFFYCLAEVKGIERTDLGFEIIYFREIDPKINMLTDDLTMQ